MNALVKRLWGTLLGCLLMCVVSAGHAAIYVGSWDPAYGPDFPNLGWRGEVKFFVPQSCVTANGVVDNLLDCGGQAVVQSAFVEFYALSDPGMATTATLTFDPLSASISKLLFSGGQLAGVLSTLFDPEYDGTVNMVDFALQMLFDPNDLSQYNGPKLYWQSGCPGCYGANDEAPLITYIEVPAPGSVALVAAGLLAAGLARRSARRRLGRM